jgi:hypothetical protein
MNLSHRADATTATRSRQKSWMQAERIGVHASANFIMLNLSLPLTVFTVPE